MDIRIADTTDDAAVLAKFFSANLTNDYISHSELQGYRAISPTEWSENRESVIRNEIAARLTDIPATMGLSEWRGVVVGKRDAELVAIALVTFSSRAAVPYGVLEDVIVSGTKRGAGHGTIIIRWVFDHLRSLGARRLFLESGLSNKKAHHLFEHLGFRPVSIVMARDI